MRAIIAFTLCFALLSCGRPARHVVPDSLVQSQVGGVCAVTVLTDITSSQPCSEIHSLVPPMGSCVIRQVLAAPSRDVLYDFLLGDGHLEQTRDSTWITYQHLQGLTLHGPIVESVATQKKEYCGSARSFTQITTEGTRIKLSDVLQDAALNSNQRNLELLYLATVEPARHSRGAVKQVNLFFQAPGPLTVTDANQITKLLLTRLNLLPYYVSVNFSNRPWFFGDEYFPLRDPLMPSLPIAKDYAVSNKVISCSSMSSGLSCTGLPGGPAVDLDGQ